MQTDSYFENTVKTVCVTLAMAKKQLRLSASNTSEDDLIQSYIDAATVDRQNYINRTIDTRDFVVKLSQFETLNFDANYENDEVASIEYYAPGAEEVTVLDNSAYKLRTGDVIGTKTIKFIDPPATEKRDDAVTVTIKQGWETAAVPTPIKQAILLLIADMYERREDRGEIGNNRAADSLCRSYRKY